MVTQPSPLSPTPSCNPPSSNVWPTSYRAALLAMATMLDPPKPPCDGNDDAWLPVGYPSTICCLPWLAYRPPYPYDLSHCFAQPASIDLPSPWPPALHRIVRLGRIHPYPPHGHGNPPITPSHPNPTLICATTSSIPSLYRAPSLPLVTLSPTFLLSSFFFALLF